MFGLLLGQSAGFAAMTRSPRWNPSDRPFMLGAAAGVSVMVALWLCLPEGITEGLGHIARALVGAAAGLMLAYGLAAGGSESYRGQQGEGNTGAPEAPADRPRD
jgi:hypothetical protein